MLYYRGNLITENQYDDIITGVKNKYSFYTLTESIDLSDLKGNDIICSASYLTSPGIRKYHFIDFYENIDSFFSLLRSENLRVNYYYFKAVDNKEDAEAIIADIKLKNFL